MTEETGAAAPTTEQAAPSAPAVSEQATQEQPSVQESAAPENAETPNAEIKEESASDDKPQRLSRNQRQQRKIARLSTMLAEQSAELEKLKGQAQSQGPQPPKEEDFSGDYFAYQRALTKWDLDQALEAKLSKIVPEQKKPDLRELNKEDIIDDLRHRIGEAEKVLPDFKQSLAGLQQHVGDLSEPLLEEIGESEKGEFILYHLSKNPQLAASLNRMSARDVAREIARLESKVSLPQPKKQTQAPAPISAPKGGATPAKDLHALAKSDDVSAYWEARKAQK